MGSQSSKQSNKDEKQQQASANSSNTNEKAPIARSVNLFERTPAAIIENSLRSHLSLREASIFSRTNTTFYGQLHPQIEVDTLLLRIAHGEQNEAEEIIKKKPGLLLQKGNVTDIAGRTFEKITAFQLALWGLDRHMWEMILETDEQGNNIYFSSAVARGQLEELEKTPTYTVCFMPENLQQSESAESRIAGLDDREIGEIKPKENEFKENTIYITIKKILEIQKDDTPPRLLSYLHYIVKAADGKIKKGLISEAELGLSIEENAVNNLLPAILKVTTKRKHTMGHGPHFDEKPLLEVYQAYIAQYNSLMVTQPPHDYVILDKPWLAIGKHQRLLPVAALNEFCRRDRSFCVGAYDRPPAFDDMVMPRELRLRDDSSFLPLRVFSGLGFDFDLLRGKWPVEARSQSRATAAGGWLDLDCSALGRLYKMRNAELVQLKRELNPVAALEL